MAKVSSRTIRNRRIRHRLNEQDDEIRDDFNSGEEASEEDLQAWRNSRNAESPRSRPRDAAPTLCETRKELDIELLPEGHWPKGEECGAPIETIQNWPVSMPDPERLSFLESLGPEEVLLVRGTFGTRRVYRPFVYRRADGRKVAVVATDRTQNATYVFWADAPSWLEVAQRTKLDVLTGSYPEFMKRVIHRGAWRDRLRSLVRG